MRNLPWLPRPLVIKAKVISEEIFCLQWNGTTSNGESTGEQHLFPLIGCDARYLECVRTYLYRARFIGPMSDLVKIDFFDKIMERRQESLGRNFQTLTPDEDAWVVLLSACERACMQYMVCEFVRLAEGGTLVLPESYDNPECFGEQVRSNANLHDIDFEEKVQMAWRKHYLTDSVDVAKAIDEDPRLGILFEFNMKPRPSEEEWKRLGLKPRAQHPQYAYPW